jgi:hypothetical protein
MNTADKARLEELCLHVYANHAVLSINGKKPYFTGEAKFWREDCSEHNIIESNKGRLPKALRLLTEANIIKKTSRKDLPYEIVDIEKARSYETKPTHCTFWVALTEEIDEADSLKKYRAIDYKSPEDLKESEAIYLFFHLNEFDVITLKEYNYYHLKETIERRDKFVLKCLVELELKYNFPKYVNLFAKTVNKVVTSVLEERYRFDKYAISTVFESNQLYDIFKTYTDNYERITSFKESLDRTLRWVNEVGGFEEAIKTMRLQIIEDLKAGKIRFKTSFENSGATKSSLYSDDADDDVTETAYPNHLEGAMSYIEGVKHLLDYAILYDVTVMGGEEVHPIDLHNSWKYCGNSLSIDIKKEFDDVEKGDEGAPDQEAKAA